MFSKRIIRTIFSVLSVLLLFTGIIEARSLYEIPPVSVRKTTTEPPYVDIKIHDIGRLGLTVGNTGSFGYGFLDVVGNENMPSAIYPYPSNLMYLFAGCFWIGSVVGRDTLVSVGADGWQLTREMWPDAYPRGEIISHSINDPDDDEAVSEQDFIATYCDTLTDPGYVIFDPLDGRPHIPLNIEITQRSYAWSYPYAEDFILFDYSIKNIGYHDLEKVYMALYVDDECKRIGGQPEEFMDDISGFRPVIASPYGCGFLDTVNIAWLADNDGRHTGNGICPNEFELTAVQGIKVVRTPSDSLKYSYNWWVSNGDAALDFGPRRRGTPEDPFRDFGGFLGTPEGDKNKYYIMRHEEFDYDQLYTAMDHSAEGWLPPPEDAVNLANGFDARFLLSFGPFEIKPGEVLPVSFAYVMGENFHTECEAFERLYNPYDPDPYYDQLSFEDIGTNAMWASWIYDNPGYDTDGDGYKGKYRICAYDSVMLIDTIQIDPPVIETVYVYTQADTLWYEGDGVPDFRGAAPPPAPIVWIYPRVVDNNAGEMVVRWNGFWSETEKDVFSKIADFEGYRVYLSATESVSDFIVLHSYDFEDYDKFIWNEDFEYWELLDPPFTIDSLEILYGHEIWRYIENPTLWLNWYDSLFYFEPHGWNQADLTDTMSAYKRFPEEPPPTVLNLDSALEYYPEELTEDGYFKYYEYEYVIRNLLPSQHYYVAVTAFDFGSPKSGLAAMETSPRINMVGAYAQHSNSVVAAENLKVVVYPNPYRADGYYRELGFEGRGQEDMTDDRVRAVHFTNLPAKCTIRIFTIDGDLVREIVHDCEYDSPECMHESWDVITRNTQRPASGIYYWVVDSDYGSQMGKLVLIM